jgi:hypothetical protein
MSATLLQQSRNIVSMQLNIVYCNTTQFQEDDLYTVRSVLPWYTVPGRWSLYCWYSTTLVHRSGKMVSIQ